MANSRPKPERPDYYATLGIEKNADLKQIRKAYRLLAMKAHPDKNLDNQKAAEEKMKDLEAAYSVLSDENKRKRYDEGADIEDIDETPSQASSASNPYSTDPDDIAWQKFEEERQARAKARAEAEQKYINEIFAAQHESKDPTATEAKANMLFIFLSEAPWVSGGFHINDESTQELTIKLINQAKKSSHMSYLNFPYSVAFKTFKEAIDFSLENKKKPKLSPTALILKVAHNPLDSQLDDSGQTPGQINWKQPITLSDVNWFKLFGEDPVLNSKFVIREYVDLTQHKAATKDSKKPTAAQTAAATAAAIAVDRTATPAVPERVTMFTMAAAPGPTKKKTNKEKILQLIEECVDILDAKPQVLPIELITKKLTETKELVDEEYKNSSYTIEFAIERVKKGRDTFNIFSPSMEDEIKVALKIISLHTTHGGQIDFQKEFTAAERGMLHRKGSALNEAFNKLLVPPVEDQKHKAAAGKGKAK